MTPTHSTAGGRMERRFSDEFIMPHLDDVLRASGSGLRFYSMHSTREAMFNAMDNALCAALKTAGGE